MRPSSADSLAKFLGAITTHPFLADFTRSLCVNARPEFDPGRRVYIGFARADIGRKLRNLETLSIFGMDALLFPPGLLQTVSLHYSHIRDLAIRTTSVQIVNTLRLIWDLPYLDSLELNRMRSGVLGGLLSESYPSKPRERQRIRWSRKVPVLVIRSTTTIYFIILHGESRQHRLDL
ncbi:hypothetical protein C8Q77DRAFT_871960 [Trametes polyzona]|nr:hypothetical protein C8Q77DRAFT_871960 [Trametes polyzona]